MTRSSDAQRLSEIKGLERAIAAKQQELNRARAKLQTARRLEAERRAVLLAADAEIAGVGKEVHRKGGGVYLNGATLDRGTLSLGDERLRFSGWGGSVEISLAQIESLEIGTSNLASRAGVPLLAGAWPGQPRLGETLMFSVRDRQGMTLAVIADVSDAQGWRRDILDRQQLLCAVIARRADLNERRASAVAALNEATTAVQTAAAPCHQIESEITTLRSQADKLRAQQREIDKAREQEVRVARERAKGKKR